MFRRLGVVALATLMVSACAELTELQGNVLSYLDQIAPGSAKNSAKSARAERQYFGGEGETLSRIASLSLAKPPVPRRKPDHPEPIVLAEPDPHLLVGLDFEATKALLGNPIVQLEQPPAKIWAYDSGTCMFSVFFYPSVDDKVFRVLTYEATGAESESTGLQTASGDAARVKVRDRDNPVLRRCFADVLQNRAVPNAG